MHPAMLYAMWTAGADAVAALGGVQALAALAFGLVDPSLPPVDMLVGVGDAYVAEAKRQLFGRVGIDLLAGPTEVLVVADATVDPRLVAADMLGQAEHGPTSVAGVIAIGEDVARAVAERVDVLLRDWPTAEIAGGAWRDHGWIAIVADDKTVTWQHRSEDGAAAIAPTIEAICAAENMLGHGRTATMRLDRLRA